MNKTLNLIGTFALVFFSIQIFSYLSENGLTWSPDSFVTYALIFLAGLVTFSLIIGVAQLIKKPINKPKDPFIDERIEKRYFQFTGVMFMLSYFILLIGAGYLVLTNRDSIPTEYVFYYSFSALFINMVVAPNIIRKL